MKFENYRHLKRAEISFKRNNKLPGNHFVAKQLIELQKTAKTIFKEPKVVDVRRTVNGINKSKVHKVQLEKKVAGKFSFRNLYRISFLLVIPKKILLVYSKKK